ncbi:MAG: hypothetical protein COV72_01045 [Candidatus Omnitrophica bacterium CG11_big_fil_rev_8_21_14_0_20_42_13]|uniref:Transposase IS200-like domain-containing protein n=1 Tax=Candidatus Ghiorseimicrobium undicola TaxID=1974746 RepID=A0A2H0LZF9_9BACT|nr:MAG: hypothetical protein COV72_01045 [Candidatus Omnitrophica bacterium CG11_big_fil_rev_8_21_14_0_20_42_13]
MDIEKLVEQGKVKRIFRARNKISYSGACCHITQRAPGRELLFVDDRDYLYMLHLLKTKSKKFNFQVYSFALLPNHFHLQICLGKDNLSAAIKNICETYAKMFNKKYSRKGHVFCGAFRQALCFDDVYLLATSLYIHLNPVRARLVDKPGKYRWSSCRLYVKPQTAPAFVNHEFILKTLDDDITRAQNAYSQILNRSILITAEEIWNHRKAIEDFTNRLSGCIKALISSNNVGSISHSLWKADLDKVVERVRNNKRAMDLDDLKERKYAIEQLRARGYAMDEIANKLKLSRKTLYNILKLHKTSIA